jgi:enoyl-CoA hydratase/carnithine racemase
VPTHDVTVERDAGLVVLRLGVPALTLRAATELRAVLEDLHEDRALRVVVVEGGADFCTGPADDLAAVLHRVDPAAALAALSVPVVLAVRGRVASVGLELALAADVRVGGQDATFEMPDVRAGRLPCWGGTQRLPRVVGRPTATAMLLLGTELDAEAARARGLLHEVADAPGVRARALAEELLRCSPLALAFGKEAVLDGSELSMRDGMRLEATLNTMLQVSGDRAEGLAAFFAKRDPEFRGE